MESPQTENVKKNRDALMSRMKERYPDQEFADDEALAGRVNEDYDDYDKRIKGYQEREKSLSDMFSSDPRSASFLTNWRNGADPVVELVRQFGTDIKEAIDDPDRLEEISNANKEFVDRVAKSKELEAQYQDNLAESLKNLDQMQQERGLDDATVDNAMELLINIVKDGIAGKFSTESIDLALKAMNHDSDVASASHEAEVRGRNSRAEAQLRTANRGDGVASLNGQNSRTSTAPQRDLGALGRFGDNNKNIWERGNEKRTRI